MNLASALKQSVPMSQRLRWNVIKSKKRGEKELVYVGALCDKLCVSLDIGANRGVYSYLMRQHSQAVIAFEPNPFYANLVRQALKDVKVIEAAISDHEGTSVLRIPLSEPIAGMGTIEAENTLDQVPVQRITIPLLTLDSLKLSEIGFVKIDVEGHELAALRGAAATIENSLPNFLIEAEERHRKGAVASVRMFLSQYGYDGLFHFDGKLLPIEAFDASTHQDLSATGKPYVNNFIFIHKSKMAKFLAATRR
jgi:FkbM family methyltransferase